MARMNGLTEDQLCEAFAEAVKAEERLQTWLLARTHFAGRRARLLHEEQMLRPRKQWWRHWWTTLADGSQRETDIFMVFEDEHSTRFALHIENKPDWGKFLDGQAEAYAVRAAEMANQGRFLNYSDSETILLCPRAFAERNPDAASRFDTILAYEDVAEQIPAFEAIT
jgi:hypothetical protein